MYRPQHRMYGNQAYKGRRADNARLGAYAAAALFLAGCETPPRPRAPRSDDVRIDAALGSDRSEGVALVGRSTPPAQAPAATVPAAEQEPAHAPAASEAPAPEAPAAPSAPAAEGAAQTGSDTAGVDTGTAPVNYAPADHSHDYAPADHSHDALVNRVTELSDAMNGHVLALQSGISGIDTATLVRTGAHDALVARLSGLESALANIDTAVAAYLDKVAKAAAAEEEREAQEPGWFSVQYGNAAEWCKENQLYVGVGLGAVGGAAILLLAVAYNKGWFGAAGKQTKRPFSWVKSKYDGWHGTDDSAGSDASSSVAGTSTPKPAPKKPGTKSEPA